MFSRGICEDERSVVEQDPRDVWPVARKHGAMVLAYSTRPDDEVRKGIVLENVLHSRARGESLVDQARSVGSRILLLTTGSGDVEVERLHLVGVVRFLFLLDSLLLLAFPRATDLDTPRSYLMFAPLTL